MADKWAVEQEERGKEEEEEWDEPKVFDVIE